MMTSLIPKSERKKTQMDLKKEIRQKLRKFPVSRYRRRTSP